MQDGQVAEYDYPIALLDNPKSFFTKLCKRYVLPFGLSSPSARPG